MVNSKARKSSKITSITKKTTPEVAVVQEEVVEKQPNITGYVVPVFVLREPVAKNIPVADIFYKKASDAITLQCYAPNQEASIEQIIEGDISIESGGNINMISKSESPESWIKNLVVSREFSGIPFIAEKAQALYEA
tara:strand:- start:1897 stop:2307 length:411 start_codon:yes stop_codon:yes gene_type:complete